MKAIKLKLGILFFAVGFFAFFGIRNEMLLTGCIALINTFILFVYHRVKKGHLPSELNDNFSELSELSRLLAKVSFLSVIMLFAVKLTCYGFDNIFFAFSQALVLLLALIPIDIAFLVRLFILCDSRLAKKDTQYILETTGKLFAYSQTTNIGLTIAVLSSATMGGFIFSSSQILILRIMSDFISLLTLYINGSSKNKCARALASEPRFISGIGLIKIIISATVIAFLVLIVYKLGLNTGDAGRAIAMSFYAMVLMNWSIAIRNWFQNRINPLVFAILIGMPLIVRAAAIYLPNTDGLFRIVRLSQSSWNKIIFFCFLLLLIEILLEYLSNTTIVKLEKHST